MRKAVAAEETEYELQLDRSGQAKRRCEEEVLAPTPPKRARSARADGSILVSLDGADGSASMQFLMRPRTTIQTALAQFAEKFGGSMENMRVYLNDQEVEINESIQSVSCNSDRASND